MESRPSGGKRKFGAAFKTVSLGRYFNWPAGRIAGAWWKELAEAVRDYPRGRQTAWGIPFQAGRGRVILTAKGRGEIAIRLTGRVDGFACDWATRYCLSAEAGPRFCGLDSDVPVPAERGASAVAAAVSKVNWGVQKRHANIAEECIRVCPARGRPQQPPLDERTDT